MRSTSTPFLWISPIILSSLIVLFHNPEIVIASAKSSKSCPGSPSRTHAQCDMVINFPSELTNCAVVQTEIVARINGVDGWQDPHNQGTYTLIESTSPSSADGASMVRGSRVTGDGKYTDQFGFHLVPNENGKGCEMSACSESQVFSILDMSTNYCNLRSLYCNASDGCAVLGAELVYTEKYMNCRQRKADQCIAGSSASDNA